MKRVQIALIALPLAVAPLFAAEVTAPSPGPAELTLPDEELDEVEVTGQKRPGNRDDIVLWLRRLAGRFSNEGTLERGGGTVLQVKGVTDCVNVGKGPGVNCVIILNAPNIQTNMNPGSFLLGVDLETPAVRYTSVDDTGVAVGATGVLRGDTATFHTPCEASGARTCTSTTHISAERGADTVRLRVEIKMDGRVTARYDVNQVRIKMP